MKCRTLSIWTTVAAGLLIATTCIGQAPSTSEQTRRDADWGKFLGAHPDVMGVHIAELEKTVAEQRDRIDGLLSRIDALEKRKPAPANAVTMPFTIKDARGRVRMMVAADSDSEDTLMYLAGGDGQPRIGFTATSDEALIELYNKSNTTVGRLHSDEDGGELHLIHKDGRAIDLDGALGVRVRGKNGNSHVQLSSDGNGGQINVYDAKNGTSVVRMRAITTGAGRLTISRADGEYVMDVGAATDGAGILKMGPNGNGAAASMTSAGRPASTLQGRNDAPGGGGDE
jgi:hypothetical protein